MRADFSRITFDPRKHYSAVLQQQGRVQVDADWNEQQRIHEHRAACIAEDVIGRSGAPMARAGLALRFTQDGRDLGLGPGRFYVDGLLCENDSGEDYVFSSTGDASVTLALARPDAAPFRPGQRVALTVDGVDGFQELAILGVTALDTGVSLALSDKVRPPSPPPGGSFTGSLRPIEHRPEDRQVPGHGDDGAAIQRSSRRNTVVLLTNAPAPGS